MAVPVTSITCPTCGTHSAPISAHRRHLPMCPNCRGEMSTTSTTSVPVTRTRRNRLTASAGATATPSTSRDHLPPLDGNTSKNEQDRTGRSTRFSGLSNFFSFGKNKNRNHDKDLGRSSAQKELPPISPGPNSLVTTPVNTTPDSNSTEKEDIILTKPKSYKDFQDEVEKAKLSGDYKTILEFLEITFSSFHNLNLTFKKNPSKEYNTLDISGVDQDFLNSVYECMDVVPNDIKKAVLKAIINSLLKDMKKPRSKDDLRAYLILVQNPQFTGISTYVIFAHLLRQMAALPDQDHHFLVHWFKLLSPENFKALVQRLLQFISVRLFPPHPAELPPMNKCTWWIPSATKVLALPYAANTLSTPPIIPYTDFYNSTLDNMDLMSEYYAWQKPSSSQMFTFCQYPYILSLAAKRTIMQKDSEQQMIIMARRSLVAKVQQRQIPDMGMLFLNLKVRRSHLVHDSLHEIAAQKVDLKKKLRVTFAGEPGLDMGGLTKEWFLLLLRKIFRQEYGMFSYDHKSHCFWFNHACTDSMQEFNLVGVLMGLAVYNSIILDIHFPLATYKKLLSPAVVPYNNPRSSVGRATFTLDDLAALHPDLAHGLKELLEYEGDVEEDLCLTFQINMQAYGTVVTRPLKANGENIPVTNENRQEYVNLYVNYILTDSVYHQFAAFYYGFHSVCASNALLMLKPEEVEILVCGNPNLNLEELEKVATYEGYKRHDAMIRYFWETVKSFPLHMQKKLLLFTTGSDRIPIGGMSEMSFKIMRVDTSPDMLPMAHTCFNQLCLPPYRTRKQLKQKLIIAISNAEGFGLE
ncbi:putative E3 ubiquitin-protein ligase HECTD2 [Saccoglossus kowalevskii]|uniref:HECT-type E3 ubiquitin transferase n=1 Tax=Saccoglossus kowalevskii TaxID=10224 RepID=A0ABM0GVF6_SACKO|nr:PREDICTED: probable E3 ubiquitin-protein ligase HECTD2 [Saccoglossus kowalevskii]